MRKVILYIAMSLDGFIADAKGGVDWLSGDGSDPEAPGSYDAFTQDIDTVIMGRNTYDQVTGELSPDAWPYEGLTTYVVTHRLLPDQPGIRFAADTPEALVRRLQAGDGKDIWICGGAQIAQTLLREDLIDRLQLTIIPTLLGDGVRLFDQLPQEQPLRLAHTRADNGMVELTYEKRDPFSLLNLRDHPEWATRAARWFHEKWQVPESVYRESIDQCVENGSEWPIYDFGGWDGEYLTLVVAKDAAWPQWYIVVQDDTIVAGCGVAEDFHDRPDLMPNLVALYIEPSFRRQGIAGRLLAHACEDMHTRSIDTLYLITEHTSFYERYGWRFLTMAHDDEGTPIRMYVHAHTEQ